MSHSDTQVSASLSTRLPSQSQQDSVRSEHSDHDYHFEDCPDLIRAISPKALLQLANEVRGSLSPAVSLSEEPMCGSFNLVYIITFTDGSKWGARIPKNGTLEKFGEPQAATMKYELELLRLIRSNTSVPVPEIFHYDTTCNNALGAPFSFCSWLDGRPAHELWHDDKGPTPLEQRRLRILDSVAEAMAQLSFFSHSLIGLPQHSAAANSLEMSNTQPLRGRDLHKEMCISPEELEKLSDDDPLPPVYYELGPFPRTADYLRSFMDNHKPSDTDFAEAPDHIKGSRRLMNIIIDAIDTIESQQDQKPCFTITHPDLDCQNILIEEDGTLKGIIDWDGVHAGILGYTAYPFFLTRDYNPSEYFWWDDDECLQSRETSPRELQKLRKAYRSLFEKHAGVAANRTTNSHLYRAVERACRDRGVFGSTITKITRTCIREIPFDVKYESGGYMRHFGPSYPEDGMWTKIESEEDEGDEMETNQDPAEELELDNDSIVSNCPDFECRSLPRPSISQDSISSTIYEDMADSLARFGAWVGLPLVVMVHYFLNMLNITRRYHYGEEESLLEASNSTNSASDNEALPHKGREMSEFVTAAFDASQADPDNHGPDAKSEDEDEDDEDADSDAASDAGSDHSASSSPERDWISPNEKVPYWTLDLEDALGQGTVSDAEIEILKNCFIEAFTSDEIIEEWSEERAAEISELKRGDEF